MANINPSDVIVVTGADVPETFTQLDIRKRKEGQPLAIQTPFGWTIFGGSKKCSPTKTKKVADNTTLSSELELNDNVKKFWEFGSRIAESANESGYSHKDVKCIKKLHQETKWLQGKYEEPMLWSDKVEELPNNFNATLQRFRSLKKRLQKDPNLCEHYKDTMQKYIKNGYARRLSNEEIDKTSQ